MFTKIALKNILAHKKKSLTTLLLTLFTTTLLVISTGLMHGSHTTMIKNAVEIYPGYIQVTHRDFRSSPGLENVIFNAEQLATKILKNKDVEVAGLRFETGVLLSTEKKSLGCSFTGIEPEKEASLSRLQEALHTGKYLQPDDVGKIYVGNELANRLKVTVGDTISFIGTGGDYSFAADNLTVKGTFQTGLFDFDANSAFVNKEYFDSIMSTENLATHIVVRPRVLDKNIELSETINQKIGNEFQVAPWQEILSSLVQAMKVDSIFGYITLSIIFMVIFFVIMIYTLLNVFTRIHEIGILRAIGTTPKQVFSLLFLENMFLGLCGVIIGGVIGGLITYYFFINPISYSDFEEQFKQYGLAASAMPAYFSIPIILRDMLIMFALTLASSVYPIVKISRYQPIEAINHV